VRQASAALGAPFSEAAAHRLADGVTGSTNELFGALLEISANLPPGRSPGIHQIDRCLADRAENRPTLREIVAVVAKYYAVPQKLLKSGVRRQSTVQARAMVAYLARELTGSSYERIGHALGGRDHTTMMHNYRKIERQAKSDLATQEAIDDLRRILLSR
jgi:chromosomal replication initiation ATPase DnaA